MGTIKSSRKKLMPVEIPASRGSVPEPESVSQRERDILNLLSRGLSNKEMGDRLSLSPFTVRNHLAHIFEKLGVHSRTQAAIAFLQGERDRKGKKGKQKV